VAPVVARQEAANKMNSKGAGRQTRDRTIELRIAADSEEARSKLLIRERTLG